MYVCGCVVRCKGSMFVCVLCVYVYKVGYVFVCKDLILEWCVGDRLLVVFHVIADLILTGIFFFWIFEGKHDWL